MTLASYDTQPAVKLYDTLMREKVKEISGTYPEDIEAKWASQVSWPSDSPTKVLLIITYYASYFSVGHARSPNRKPTAC